MSEDSLRPRSFSRFVLGDWVELEVSADTPGGKVSTVQRLCVVGCLMGSDTLGQTYSYHLTNDPPRAWHCGTIQYRSVPEERLRPMSVEQKVRSAAVRDAAKKSTTQIFKPALAADRPALEPQMLAVAGYIAEVKAERDALIEREQYLEDVISAYVDTVGGVSESALAAVRTERAARKNEEGGG